MLDLLLSTGDPARAGSLTGALLVIAGLGGAGALALALALAVVVVSRLAPACACEPLVPIAPPECPPLRERLASRVEGVRLRVVASSARLRAA